MIVDLPFLKKIAKAMNERMEEAQNTYERLEKEILSISTSEWDDKKREEYTRVVSDMRTSVSHTIIELKEYISYLQTKIKVLENKDGC